MDTVPDDNFYWTCLTDLTTELLVIIISYLPICDKINMRYVCQRFKDVSETPLLWKNFVWPGCEPHHVRSMSALIKVCGEHVKRIFFPAHVTPIVLLEMAQCCTKVTHLSLPKYTQLSLDDLEEIVRRMTHLQELDVFTYGKILQEVKGRTHEGLFIRRLLKVTANNVKKLKLRNDSYHPDLIVKSIELWANQDNPLPPVIIIITRDWESAVTTLFKFWSASMPKIPSLEICVYNIKIVPMSLYPSVPIRKFQFGPAAASPFIDLSDHGILNLNTILTLHFDYGKAKFSVSDYNHYGEVRYSITPFAYIAWDNKEADIPLRSISNLHSVSNIDFCNVNMKIDPSHLEQLAVVCPGLQRLNVAGNKNCLNNLRGLQAIVQTCKSLEGLSLAGISVSMVESYLLLWELLSGLKKLTHLAINMCVLKPYELSALKHCHSLQALEIHCDKYNLGLGCIECAVTTDLTFSHFPSLTYCRMVGLRFPGFEHALTNCHQLKYLYADCSHCSRERSSLPTSSNSNHLQQIFINSQIDLTDEFLDVLSAYGGLECVVLCVDSITISGITKLINNSPNLMVLHVVIEVPLFDDDNDQFDDTTWSYLPPPYLHGVNYTDRVMKMFSYRKLFSIGSFKVNLDNGSVRYKKETFIPFDSNLNSLWV